MKILVDADSCPPQVREIVARAAARVRVPAVYIANRRIPFPGNDFVTGIVVPAGQGAADRSILEKTEPGDLVVTRDIPLAKLLVDAGAVVINDRGTVYTRENVGERLSLRDFSLDLIRSGIPVEQKDRYGGREVRSFAAAFDRELTRAVRRDAGRA
jgi:uncharacterized protein YaiI (UPF0178 family)